MRPLAISPPRDDKKLLPKNYCLLAIAAIKKSPPNKSVMNEKGDRIAATVNL